MSSEIRDWLREMKANGDTLPANIVPPEFVPAMTMAEMMGTPPEPLFKAIPVEPGQMAAGVADVNAANEEAHDEWLNKMKESTLTPEQVLAQCSEMGDAQYQAYMAELQASDPAFCAAVLDLVAKSQSEQAQQKSEQTEQDAATGLLATSIGVTVLPPAEPEPVPVSLSIMGDNDVASEPASNLLAPVAAEKPTPEKVSTPKTNTKGKKK